MRIQVICCNDRVEFAVVNDAEAARVEVQRLKREHFEKVRKLGIIANEDLEQAAEDYKMIYCWHIHEVDGK